MRKIIFILLFISSIQSITAQVAVIEDKDGYTNVRQAPNANAEIIYKITVGEVFIIDEEINGWVTVHIPFEKFSKDLVRRGLMRGYVHKSRIRPLEKMEKYTGDEYTFKYEITPFIKEGKTIQYEGDDGDVKILDRINEDYFYGTDGELPKKEVKSLTITVNGKKIDVPENLIKDIYEVTNDFVCYKIDDKFIIFQGNSDGAGYYELVWVFNEQGLIQRLISDMN